jgi:membrane protein implicated in regulation of membrane protease activity
VVIGIQPDLVLSIILEAAALILEEIVKALSWWQWLLFFIGIAVNVWVADESKKRALQRERDRQEMLSTLHLIDNQIKVMKNTKKQGKLQEKGMKE